jgi:signal transduction histidine kinase
VLFDVSDLLAEVGDTLRPLAGDKGVELVGEVCEGAGSLCCDRTAVEQILINLVGNAVKFTDMGRVSVRAMRKGPDIVFEVSDTGCGVPREEMERIFTEFYQSSAPGVQPAGGTGLGLSVSRRLAVGLGGSIEADSEVGVGSVFSVRLPVDPALGR